MNQPPTEGLVPALSNVANRRARSVTSAVLAVVLAAALAAGAGLHRAPYLLAVGAVQAVLVAAWWTTVRPPGRTGVAVVGAAAAVAADVAVLLAGGGTLDPVLGVVAMAFVVAAVTQLLRGVARSGVTESFGSTMLLTVCGCALAGAVALRERPGGPDVLAVVVTAAGVGLAVAHLVDSVRAVPELSPGTGRGGLGVALGGAAGAFAAGVVGEFVVVPGLQSPVAAALVGGLVALTAVLVDVGQDCAAVGREQAGERVPPSWLGAALGPSWGLVAAVVGAYVVGNVVLA